VIDPRKVTNRYGEYVPLWLTEAYYQLHLFEENPSDENWVSWARMRYPQSMTIPFEFSRRIKGDRDGLAKFERANF
jgi:hypothetical protein